jgi:flagellar motility protein MotE (MotC chaperone)
MSIPRPYQQKNPSSAHEAMQKKRMEYKSGLYKKAIFSLGLLVASYVFVMKCFLFSSDIPALKNLVQNSGFLSHFPIKLSVGSTVIASENTKEQSPQKKQSNKSEEEEDEEDEESTKEKDLLELSSKNQIQTLYHLTARRKEIETREKQLKQKEQKLDLVQQEIASKLKQLFGLQQEIKKTILKIDEQEKARILKLVKIYESMKPKDAARVFNKLDNNLIQQILENMSQKKIALILSEMDSQRVKEATVIFANKKNTFSK